MNEPQINVDRFYHRPVYHVVGLLSQKSQIPAISAELQSARADIAAVEILCGEQGAHILDEHGATTGYAGASCEPSSGSVTTERPWRSATRRSGTATCSRMSGAPG